MYFKNCYVIGPLSSANLQPLSFAGFLGNAGYGNYSGTFTSCFWDTQTTTQAKGVMPDEKLSLSVIIRITKPFQLLTTALAD